MLVVLPWQAKPTWQGGKNSSDSFAATYEFDPAATKKWTEVPGGEFPKGGIRNASSFTLAGKAYLAGGLGDTGFLAATYEFDPATTKTWTEVPGGELPKKISNAISFTLADKVYLAGGEE